MTRVILEEPDPEALALHQLAVKLRERLEGYSFGDLGSRSRSPFE